MVRASRGVQSIAGILMATTLREDGTPFTGFVCDVRTIMSPQSPIPCGLLQ